MLVKMNHARFAEADDFALSSLCFDPLIRTYKDIRAADGDVLSFFRELTDGQQALFMFRTYYDHVHASVEKLYWWSAYLMAQPARWGALKKGLLYFEDHAACQLCEDIDAFLSARHVAKNLENFDVSMLELQNDPDLHSTFQTYYKRYQENTPNTIARIAARIRSHTHEFIDIIEP